VTVEPLAASGVGWIEAPVFDDARGSLTATDLPALPFLPVRMFSVYGVPVGEVRGVHAHRRCHQILTCVHGSVHVTWDDGSERGEVVLDRPSRSLLLPAMVWGGQRFDAAGAVLIVLASLPYDRGDYIDDYDEFLAELRPIS
jgi:UDP-2-acetamido-3-amino-2,3-dideoxy-glucuronate N-acetyltransferase